MAVVESIIARDDLQANGSRKIHERHTDHVGEVYWVRYVAAAAFDAAAAMNARVPQINAHLVEIETQRNIEKILAGEPASALTTEFVVIADMRQALRGLYQAGTGEDIGRLAAFFLTISNANLSLLWGGLTNPQLNQLKSRFQERVDELDAVLSAVGE